MEKRFPTLSTEHAVGRLAEKIFESRLASNTWNDIKIPQERDFGLDYRVECAENGELRGCEFFVQLKGVSNLSQGDISVQISTTTLRYWCGKLLPILIVVVDCKDEEVYYTWFDRDIRISEDQATQTLKIPRHQVLTNTDLLASMRVLYRDWGENLELMIKDQTYFQILSLCLFLMKAWSIYAEVLFLENYSDAGNLEIDSEHENRMYALCYSSFSGEILSILSSVPLNRNPIDCRIKEILVEICELWNRSCVRVPIKNEKEIREYVPGMIEGWKVGIYCADTIRKNMPRVRFLLWEIIDFLEKHCLRRQN